jgi:ATP-dependent Clp protease ATP-binding subunit ClpC
VLEFFGLDLRIIRREVEKLVQSGPDMVTMGRLPQTPRVKRVIEYSKKEARALNHNCVDTEHILLGLLREQEGVAAQMLMTLGVKLEEVREELLNRLRHGAETSSSRQIHPIVEPFPVASAASAGCRLAAKLLITAMALAAIVWAAWHVR